jgi:methyl-accepting chemotaxis protein
VAESIGRLTASSEAEFLRVGDRLREFFGRSQVLSKKAADVAARLSGEEAAEAARAIEELARELDHRTLTAGQRIESAQATLEEFQVRLDKVLALGRFFQQMVKHMKIFKVYFRIEAAHLSGNAEEFHGLAEEVGKQAQFIGDRVNGLLERVRALYGELMRAAGRFQHLRTSRAGRDQEARTRLTACLDGIGLRRRRSLEMAALLADRAQAVAAHLGEVVVSLQFHDIIRQRLEHVQSGLLELEKETDEKTIRSMTGLQAAQLSGGHHDLETALTRMTTNLEGIGSRLRELSDGLTSDRTDSLAGTCSFLDDLEKNLSSAGGALEQAQTAGQELDSALTGAARMMEDIQGFLKDVLEIGETVKYIALGATIKASRLGRDGAAIQVLAVEIRRLSADATLWSQEISETLRGLADSARILEQSSAGAENAAAGPSDPVLSTLQARMETLRMENQVQALDMDQWNENVLSLAREVDGEAARVRAEQGFPDGLKKEVQRLEGLAGPGFLRRSTAASAAGTDPWAGLAGRYTMASERVVHRTFVAGAPGASAKASPAGRKAADDDLGDNVELF